MLVDDGSAAVSLPELPLLAVLPGTGGLTRVTDKRKVRRDHADVFCTTEEGVKGKRAVEWRLVDEVVPRSKLDEAMAARVKALAGAVKRAGRCSGIALTPLERERSRRRAYAIRRRCRHSSATSASPPSRSAGPDSAAAGRRAELVTHGARTGRCAARASSTTRSCICGSTSSRPPCIVFKTRRRSAAPCSRTTNSSTRNAEHWLAREILWGWKRVLKRIDVTSRSLVALIEPGSCFAGTLAELALRGRPLLHADRPIRRATTARPRR